MMRFSLSLFGLVAASGLAACNRVASGPVVGFAQIGGESNWRTAETRSMREEAERRGIHLRIADAQRRQENQIKALRGFIAQELDAIVLAPMEKNGWEPVLREVKEAGIPLVLIDRGVAVSDEGLYATLIASDFVEEGRMAARWLVEATGGTCNVVELQGSVGSDPAIERRNGFLEVLAQHQGMSVLRSQSAEFTRSRGKEVMEAFIKAEGKRIQAVYAHNDDMALGAIQALEEAGMRPGSDVLVVSIDGIRDAFEAMAAGKLNATVECNPLLGPLAFDALERILRGEPVEKRVIVKDRLFTADQAAAELPNRAY
jgi:ABC-type sugar transport system substrate-binding protein